MIQISLLIDLSQKRPSQIWAMYKKAEASFWTAEELDLAHDLKVCVAEWLQTPVLVCNGSQPSPARASLL